jgi:hypothetical protein
MSSNINLSCIVILSNQTNYCDWSLEIKATARLSGFWKAYNGTNVASTGSINVAEIDQVEQCEEQAMGLSLKTVTSNFCIKLKEYCPSPSIPTVTYVTTAKIFWDYLCTKFEKQGGISTLLNFEILIETRLVDDSILEGQLNALKSTRSRCALNSIKLENWQYAALLLIRLLETYKHISDSFLITGKINQLDPTTIIAKIIKTKIHHKAESSASANMVNMRASDSNTSAKKKNKKPPADQPCHYCKKSGHWSCNCKKKKADKAKQNKSKSRSSSLNVVDNSDAESDSPVFTYFGSPKLWLVDSGATDHMSLYGPDFTDYVKNTKSHHDTIVLGDGST